MSISKRRGRPAGTDYKEDLDALGLVADLLVADPALKPSTAMRSVCKSRKWKGQTDEAIVARLLRKWKTLGAAQLASARERRVRREPKPVTVGRVQFENPAFFAEVYARMTDFQAKMAAVSEPARKAMERIAESMNNPSMRTFLEQQKKIAERFALSPAFKELQIRAPSGPGQRNRPRSSVAG
jgi:hypothetical protein